MPPQTNRKPKPGPGISDEARERILARLSQQPEVQQSRILPQFQSAPTPMGPTGSTGAGMPMGNPVAPTPTPTPTLPTASPAPVVPPGQNPGLLQWAKTAASRPFGQSLPSMPGGGSMPKIPTWGAGIAAGIAPNFITPFTPQAVDPYVQMAGQGAALGALGGPLGMAAGAGGGLAVQAGQDIGRSSIPTPFLPALGAVSPIGAAVSLGTRFFGGEEGPKPQEFSYADAIKSERNQFFESLKTMGIQAEDLRFLKTLYDTQVGPVDISNNTRLVGLSSSDWTDASNPIVAQFYGTHQAAIQQLTGMATEMFGQQRQEQGIAEAEQTAYDRQQSAQDQLIAALESAQSRELSAQNRWMEDQQSQYQAALAQQQDFATTAQQWTADYLAPFQSRLQESSGNQAAYLQQQAANNPQFANIYNDLAQSVEFQTSQALQNQAATGQLMPQMVYQQQVQQLSPPNWGNYQSQGPSAYEQLILQALGSGY